MTSERVSPSTDRFCNDQDRRATGKTGRLETPATVEPTVEAQAGRPVANGATVNSSPFYGLSPRRLRSTPTTRAVDAWFDWKAFGGPKALWHGSGCTCSECVEAGYACACGDPHCEDKSHV